MSEDNNALSALGALLGYIGAEAATTAPFEHLLWPQRYLSNFSWSTAVAAALLMPMGGPLHKAALETFDTLHRHGLFKGSRRGHMLGTAFFKEIGWTYNMHNPGQKLELKETRNCIWATALGLLPVPEIDGERRQESPGRTAEKGAVKKKKKKKDAVRARISVNHLTFSQATSEDKASGLPFVREDMKIPGFRVFLALLVAESTAVIVAAVLAAVWRTLWALLWLAPLILRLLSAAFAVHREPMTAVEVLAASDQPRDFQIHCPQSNGDFMVFTGPPAIVLQFMRHYAHPIRHRGREILQLATVMALGTVFPLGLVASALLMPLKFQYVWFGYQMFLVVGLHFARYSQYVKALSTDAAIAEAFECDGNSTSGGRSILFGHKRYGPETIRVDLAVTYHDRHADGKKAVERLLARPSDDGTKMERDLLAPSRSGTEVLK